MTTKRRCRHFWRARHTPMVGPAPYRPHCKACCRERTYAGVPRADFYEDFESRRWN